MTAAAAAHYAGQRHFVGVITPSGNTVVERISLGVASLLPEVSMHFSRTPVFGSTDPSPTSYAMQGFLDAARLLAHAAPDVLVWNGSKAAGIGFDHDRKLAAAIEAETGIRTTTSILGMAALLQPREIRRIAIVTPYSDDGQRKTLECLAHEGFNCVAHAHAGLSDNLSYASVPSTQIEGMVREVSKARPQAIVCLCTNFPAAVVAAEMEAELSLPVYDSTALGVWHAFQLAGVDTRPAAGLWGSLFSHGL